jgi:hypothetical protein
MGRISGGDTKPEACAIAGGMVGKVCVGEAATLVLITVDFAGEKRTEGTTYLVLLDPN